MTKDNQPESRRGSGRRQSSERRKYTGKFEGLERRKSSRRQPVDRRWPFAGGDAQPAKQEELSIRDLINTVWQGKILIVVSFVIIMSITALVIQQIVPRYTASTSVMINSRKLKVVDVDDVLSSMNLDAAIVQTEVEIIRSREIIHAVVKKLRLATNTAFVGTGPNAASKKKKEGFAGLKEKVEALFGGDSNSADDLNKNGDGEDAGGSSSEFLRQMAAYGVVALEAIDLGSSDTAEQWRKYVNPPMPRRPSRAKIARRNPAQPAPDKKVGFADFVAGLKDLSDRLEKSEAMAKPKEPVQTVLDSEPLSDAEILTDRAINAILGRLTVHTAGRSLVINVGFTSEDPKLAARIANTVAEQYIQNQIDIKRNVSYRANEWLNDRIIDLRQRTLDSENETEIYRAKTSLEAGGSNKVGEQQLSEVSSQVILAQRHLTDSISRYRVAKDVLKKKNPAEAAAEAFESRAIINLRKEEAKLLNKYAELTSRYNDAHPKIIKMAAEVKSIKVRLDREIRKIIEGLGNEVQVAREQITSLRINLNELEIKVSRQNKSDVKLRQLEREAKANREIYSGYLGRLKEISNQDVNQQADARIISMAIIPTSPSYPKTNIIYALGVGVALFIGIFLVFIRARLDNRFKSPDEVERLTGIPSLGLIPFDKAAGKRETFAKVNIFDRSLFTEAIRTLHTSLLVSDGFDANKVICVTSSMPSEGKTLTTLSLARVASMSGQRVLVVDCDLRRPNIHRAAKISNKDTIVDLLEGKIDYERAITVDQDSGAHLIPSKVFHGNPLDLLRSEKMEELVNSARRYYDLVLLDTPSILAVSDPRIVSRIADRTLYLVKWDGVPKESVLAGVKSLQDIDTNFVGVVMTQVDLKKHVKYGYVSGGYYYGNYAEDPMASGRDERDSA